MSFLSSHPLLRSRRLLDEDGNLPRMHFDTFGSSMLSLFNIATCEGWNGIFYSLMHVRVPKIHWHLRSTAPGSSPGCVMVACCTLTLQSDRAYLAAPYVIVWLLAVTLVLFNLFVTVILENFEVRGQRDAAIPHSSHTMCRGVRVPL